MALTRLHDLVERRISDTEKAINRKLILTWDIGDWPHFHTPRGFGVTLQDVPLGPCHMRLAQKLVMSAPDRQDGIVRHELGHVVDMSFPAAAVTAWAAKRGVRLPVQAQAELRADAIAKAVWGADLRYDDATVQSTTRGVIGRPQHLGY